VVELLLAHGADVNATGIGEAGGGMHKQWERSAHVSLQVTLSLPMRRRSRMLPLRVCAAWACSSENTHVCKHRGVHAWLCMSRTSMAVYTHSTAHPRTHTHTHKHALTHAHTRGYVHARCAQRGHAARAFGRVRARFVRRVTALHAAAGRGDAPMTAVLLAHGADVQAKDKNGCGGRSLFWATVGVRRAAVADRDRTDAMQIGMRAKDRLTRTHMHANAGPSRAVWPLIQCWSVARMRCRRRASFGPWLACSLSCMCMREPPRLLGTCMLCNRQHGRAAGIPMHCPVASRRRGCTNRITPLHHASVVNGTTAVVELLLAHGADVNATGIGEAPGCGMHKQWERSAHVSLQVTLSLPMRRRSRMLLLRVCAAWACSSENTHVCKHRGVHAWLCMSRTSMAVYTHSTAHTHTHTHTHKHAQTHAHTRGYVHARCAQRGHAARAFGRVRARFVRRATALLFAAGGGHAAMTAALLAHGADVHAKAGGCGGRSLFWVDGVARIHSGSAQLA
jgi:hypothetical protein